MKVTELDTRKTTILLSGVMLLLMATVVAWAFFKDPNGKNNAVSSDPQYPTVLPEGSSIKELGGWQRVSPPENDPVYAYADSIDDVPIRVSEQPLPEQFRNNTEGKVKDLAEQYGATETIEVENNTLYVGTSTKGPQSAIFSKDKLLILIKSERTIEDEAWAKYVRSLN